MISPIQTGKTYGVLHTESFFSFLGFAKKVGSDEIQKVDVFLDDKLIDTIEANEFIQKIDDMYDVESKAFTYNLPTQYIGKKAIISFKNHDSGEELLNSPYTLIDKNHEKFNEAKFLHSLSEPLSEELKNMYKPNCVGFLATKENLEDEEFVEYINEIIKDFPEYDFKALYFDKNSIKEIKNKFQHSNLNLIELKSAKDIFENLEVYIGHSRNSTFNKVENILRKNENEIAVISTNLNIVNKSILEISRSLSINKSVLNNLEYFGFNKNDLNNDVDSFLLLFFTNAAKTFKVDIKFNFNDNFSKGNLFYRLKLGFKNHDFFKYNTEFNRKLINFTK
ncbi:hypothetical protein [Aliarcobacter skirrowii]|uniref:Uncharacterized protein n=1 Tax=Aliarcobacter skirrowii TaxID=28200 RepID=A0AAW9DBA4_9BACT|nr:hypothetical protein [Aliarcobacter skirrowii]MDX4069427.1 hypothetical protein [Aliarcobacter skirrowii]